MTKHYIDRPVEDVELDALAEFAEAEEKSFFARNPHLVAPYRARLVGVALCQGAALQYLGRGYGVNDFDVHYFYCQNPAKPRLSRTVKRLYAAVGRFNRVPVDFVRTVIPSRLCASHTQSRVDVLRAFFQQAHTATAIHLARKAAVGLLPQELRRVVIWPNAAV